jgi:hypothetical protein
MKKTLTLLLSLLMLFSLAACGGGDAANSSAPAASEPVASAPADTAPVAPTPAPAAPDAVPTGDAMAALISWMMDGTYAYDYKMTSSGPDGEMTATGSMAMDGGKMSMVQQVEQDGQTISSHIILKDDKTYIIDQASKTIIAMQGLNEEALGGVVTDYSGIAKTGQGEGEIDGKTLPYEEYTQEGEIVRYYLQDGQVYGIETTYEGYTTLMIITNPQSSVPAGAFDLPEGYALMEF